ncbi:B3 domain-containing protein Os01g0234100-like [Solanum verrucosum]|uniref:B3 domain-containing protein Os01g0234100-like n=1 Tax=Solanum verrucosum TaxID=315347 RepID=UPI0020D1B5CA|nr:B3 domain-containing protein Os01g0234100-like [Solanum verrucosum]
MKSRARSPSKKKALSINQGLLKKNVLPPNRTNKVEKRDNKKAQMCIRRKEQTNNSVDISSSAQVRAEIFETTLPAEFPHFLKCMLRSHVTWGFCLSFPKRFCVSHLPKHDGNIVLVDEDGDEFSTKYLIGKSGLSGGWRGFSIAHNLVENDVLVFQLIETCKFKVHILRENCLSPIDVAVVLMDFIVEAHNEDQNEKMNMCEANEDKYLEPHE